MTKKKIIYIVLGVVALVLVYFNYYGSDKEVGDIKKIVETINAVYESDDYHVEAEKEIDYLDEKESKFEKAKAIIQGMILSGDNVFLDKDKNLTLDTNILGISPNGWEIKASELKFNKETKELVSTKPMYAKNEEKGVEILANKFKTTISMDNITLEDGVVIKNKLFSILADKANYDNNTKIITLEGNTKLSNRIGEVGDINTLKDVKSLENTSNNKKEKEISGTFSKVYFNLNERNLYATDGFDMKYDEVGLKGKDIVLNETTQSFKVTGDVKFTYQDYIFDVSYIEKEPNSDIINVYGQIKGGNPIYSVLADKGEYNINDKKIRIFGNVDITSTKGEKLNLDNFVYSSETKEADMYGNKIKYTSPTNNLEAEYIHYNTVTKEITTDKPFDSWNEKGEGITGTNIVYNLGTKDFYSKENITVKNKDYGLTTKNVTYKEETGILSAPEPYVIKSTDETSTINGKSITYNKKTGELTSPGEIILNNKGTIMKGHDLVYNNISGLGKLQGPIPFENKEDKMSGTAKEIIIKKGDYVDLIGPIKVKQDTTNMLVDNARYSYKDELVHVNTPVKFNDPVKSMVGSVSSATYSLKDSILKGTNFNMKEPDRSAKAQNIVLYNKENRRLELIGNAYLSSGKDNISGPKIVYYLDTKDAETPTNSIIHYDQYTVKSTYGKVNKESGEIFVKNADVKSLDGNDFSSNQAKGNINNIVHFTGNVKGKSKQKEGDVYFTGDKADLYMSKVDDKYQAKKVIVNTKSTFTQLNRKIVSNYMELDLIKKEVYAKDKPVLIIDDGEKGNTLVKADDVTGYIDKELIKLNKNVYVKNINEKKEETVLTADRGTVTKQMADVYDRVKVVTKDSVITANEGHYDIVNRKIRAKGNVHVDYTSGKSASSIFNNTTSTKKK
ncbi:LptA/OstA family protein [Fusobacterium nucleatum]|uniref:OstA-like protein n=1 Tax=Fusobacterium nucleatum TaxID=851 RepID=A0A133P6T8_FUSNU|nr:LptA/OstA family protein [Fusobacterium nucleatum]KXA24258.1 OstA-like protein [Fusobacterium nucleatum]MCL4583696.1 S-layer protein [Fusobacterium nucleatum YWH7054]MCL4592414.1 S-layer protein [Fusobacterium nucleatum YWH7053]